MSELLIQMAWKSTCIAATAAAMIALFRHWPSTDRARILHISIGTLLLLPAISLCGPKLPIEIDLASRHDFPSDATVVQMTAGTWGAVVVTAYFVGFAILLSRFLLGLWLLQRWTARGSVIVAREWTDALSSTIQNERRSCQVRLIESDAISSPISWGWQRPCILIDRSTLAHPEEARAVLAHEGAHIARCDWLLLAVSHIVLALYWFNPAVWMLKRMAEQHAEEAADAQAARTVEPAHYAQVLINCVRRHGSQTIIAAIGIGREPQGLSRRVRAVLETPRSHGSSSLNLHGLAAGVLLAVPFVTVEFIPTREAALPATELQTSTAVRTKALVVAIDQGQIEADRQRHAADAAQASALATGDVEEIGRAAGIRGRADASQGWVHALRGELARLEAERR